MTVVDLQQYLRAAGWPESLIVTMAAIGMAESSGNPRAHNSVPPDDSYGLWQINMIGSLGPARRARYGLSSNEALYDPLMNARVALDIYQQQGLRAWGPYVTGAYRKYIPQSQAVYSPHATPTIPAVVNTQSETYTDYQDSDVEAPGDKTKTLAALAIGGGLLWLLLR